MENLKASRRLFGLSVAVTIALLSLFAYSLAAPGRSAAALPKTPYGAPPLTKVQAPKGKQVATFAAGCFWSIETMFKQLKGVEKVEPGYAGGKFANPTYEQVSTGRTGFAETAQITFDPKVISYQDLVKVMLTVHDPTTMDKQGADEGPQYRSIIFYHSEQQRKAARVVIADFNARRVWNAPIVTLVKPFTNFYRAEDYHVDYYNRHPNESYCQFVIAPKVRAFREKFVAKLKS